MQILIIEDEARIARRLKRMVELYFGQKCTVVLCDSLSSGLDYLQASEIDLLLLDLNLNGENGFDVLGAVVVRSFHTIVVSANTDRAIDAFGFGVLDFVPKPFDQSRLFAAFERLSLTTTQVRMYPLKFLAIKKVGTIKLIDINQVVYFKGAGIYSEIHLKDGSTALHDKSLDHLQQLLSTSFERIHKSFLLNLDQADRIEVQGGSKYSMLLKNKEILPIGRSRYPSLKEKLL